MSLDESGIMYAGTQSNDDDKKLWVTFSYEPRLDKRATLEAGEGLNKYRDVEYITIRIPGDKTLAIHRPISPSDKMRFPLQYAAFRNSSTGEQILGFPLSAWPGCKPSQVRELEYFNVRTVEQLASMPDGVGGANLMGIHALRMAAKQFVDARKSEAPVIAMQEALKLRDSQIEALTVGLAQQTETVNRLLAALPSEKQPKGK